MTNREALRTLRDATVASLLASTLAGCAGVAEVAGTATEADLMQLRADVTQLQLALQRARAETEKQTSGVEARLAEQTAQSQRQTEDLARRLETLSTSLGTLSARVDDLAARLETLSRRGATATPSPRATSPGTSAGGGPRQGASAVQPQDVYQTAYIDYSKGSYPLAIAGFREFLRRFPEHALAANAQYWIGEAHFSIARGYVNAAQTDKATEELERAVQEFRKVIANYPRADKAPTALYKEALALLELKQPALAMARLQYLIENFPQAEETPLARERLAALKGG